MEPSETTPARATAPVPTQPPKLSHAKDPEWDEERQLFLKVIATFKNYRGFTRTKLERTFQYLRTLPPHHQELLSDYKDHLEMLKTCIDVNQSLFNLIVQDQESLFENQADVYNTNDNLNYEIPKPTAYDYEKLNGVLKQMVRDWSPEGIAERQSCYTPIIKALEEEFQHIKETTEVSVLVPGAGTGRLAHEIVRRGYTTEGNEFSMYMLFASNFILNKCNGTDLYESYPWISEGVNVLHHRHQTSSASFPDINPSDLPQFSKFSMTAGDFLDVYSTKAHEGAWDCIVTCFVIDCATNIVGFIEQIWKCLKENGIWINLGPLLYHYADLPGENSIEPSYDFLVQIIKKLGFIFEKEDSCVPTKYSENRLSMLRYSYNSVFFVCRKPKSSNANEELPPTESD